MPTYEGFQALAQSYISEGIASNYYLREPLLALMAALSGAPKPTALEIGRPSAPQVFAGTKLSNIQRMDLASINSYRPQFQYQNPVNTKIEGARDTAPVVANPTTSSQSQISGTAEIFWTGLIKEPILVWKSDLDRAVRAAGKDMKGRGVARATVLNRATEVARQNVLSKIVTEIYTGSPTDQDSDPLDHLIGLSTWMSATNYCARVNRSIAKNATWRANVDNTARAPVASELIDYANIQWGLEDKTEQGAMLLLCNNAQYPAFKAEVLAKGWEVATDTMPEFAEYGMKRSILRKDNCYIARSPNMPANTCYVFYLPVWKWITHPDHTFRVTPFRDLSEYQEGGKEALQAFVELQVIFSCDNPGVNGAFTNITDPSA